MPSMIHSARSTVRPVAITILTWKLFCFAIFWKVGTDIRTETTSENSDHYRPWLWVGLVDQKTIQNQKGYSISFKKGMTRMIIFARPKEANNSKLVMSFKQLYTSQ